MQQLFGQNSGDAYLATTIEGRGKPTTLAACTVRDSKSADVILKIVNGAETAAALRIELAGIPESDLKAVRTVLTGPSADAINEDGQPPAIKPVSSEVTLSTAFAYEAPANSLTVFRIRNP